MDAKPPAPPSAAPAPDAPPASSSTPPAPNEAPPAPPGDQYYVEPPGAAAAPQPLPFEPPPPGRPLYEPPPPPQPRHVAPRMSLWAGARLGWFFPFGNLWARGVPAGSSAGSTYYVLQGKPWSTYASSGPMLELNLGLRLSRSYTVFAVWERAETGSGSENSGPDGEQARGDSDFWALALRANSNPNRLGFVTEVAIGYRRARTLFESGAEYQFTDAPFEARLGLGAEYRFSRTFTLSALASVGVGGFGLAERVGPNGNVSSLTTRFDEGDGHAWATLGVGGHFDLLPSAN